ncbi:MAG: hypothetical protein KF732_11830 [Flavobacteriales bacterium]|jgi:hypothetical protein|nr:hypothetical protein [Flavobacteriales bacterium]
MNNGQFKKGNKGKPKGAINNTTKELREKFTLLLENNFDKLQTDIDMLEPKDRVKTLLEISKFVIPTLKATDLSLNMDNEVNIKIIDWTQ